MPNLVLVTAPTVLPISTAIVMATARVEDEAETDLFTRLIGAATELVQDAANYQLMVATYRLERSGWPSRQRCLDCVRLPKSNRATVSLVRYRDSSGTLVTWDAANYQVVQQRAGVSEVWPIASGAWPVTAPGYTDAVQVTYTSGVSSVDSLPPHARTAVEQLAIHLYQHPAGSCDVPQGIQTLIRSFRVVDAELDRQLGEESLP